MLPRHLPLLLAISAGFSAGAATSRADDSQVALRRALFKRPTLVISAPTERAANAGVPNALKAGSSAFAPPPLLPTFPNSPAPPELPNVSGALRELAVQPATFTPYDRYLGSVRNVVENSDRGPATMMRACRLMKEAHSFRYRRGDPYRAAAPEVTVATHSGDCKAKALWLYEQLGDGSALYVIGKADKGARNSHAWVYWRFQDRWWILDPTNRSSPVASETLPTSRYVPYYSFGKAGAFRHRATRIFLASAPGAVPAVAAREAILQAARR